MDSDVRGMPADLLVQGLKKLKSEISVVAICGPGQDRCPSADHELESFDPKKLLQLLGTLMPNEADRIEKHEEELNREI